MPTFESDRDARFMALAHALGRRALGQCWPNPAVGAVIVRRIAARDVIAGRGWTQKGGRPHAETEALRRAGDFARGATAYVTLEPCSHHGKTPPCAEALAEAGIARVVAAIEDPNPQVAGRGHALLRRRGIEVTVGVGREEALRVHAGHFRLMGEGRPHVTLKLAVSADDKIGLPGRRPVAITGEAARARVHLMRAMSDAILIGIGTAEADDPLLTCRLPGLEERSPVRIVLDRQLRLSPASQLVQTAKAVPLWVIAGQEADERLAARLCAAGAEVLRIAVGPGEGLALAATLQVLGGRGITRLMVEGGARVAASFVAEGLVDEVVLFRSGRPIGRDAVDALEGLPLSVLTSGLRLRGVETADEDKVEIFERVC